MALGLDDVPKELRKFYVVSFLLGIFLMLTGGKLVLGGARLERIEIAVERLVGVSDKMLIIWCADHTPDQILRAGLARECRQIGARDD